MTCCTPGTLSMLCLLALSDVLCLRCHQFTWRYKRYIWTGAWEACHLRLDTTLRQSLSLTAVLGRPQFRVVDADAQEARICGSNNTTHVNGCACHFASLR